MNKVAVITALIFASGFSLAFAEEDEKLAFAGYLEETLGHFHALELNLDDSNAELAIVHATHPIAELYDLMKPELQEYDPEFDTKVQQTLTNLREKTIDVTREDAQAAIDEARTIIEEARMLVVGEALSGDPNFKLALVKGLLETSAAEYAEAVEGGEITEMVEFQDGSAFVWQSQKIFDEIKASLPEHEVEEIDEFYADLWSAYDDRSEPSLVQTLVNGITHEIDEITGEESGEVGLESRFENIENHLSEVKEYYADGNTDEALSHATKAYLDEYEYLEAPISQYDDELMEKIEIMLREDLRKMIKDGAPTDDVNAHIDAILQNLDEAEDLVLIETTEAAEDETSEVMSPLKQVKSGIEPNLVDCGAMELIIKKSTGSPACVKDTTAEKLIQAGWGIRPQ
jgi:hypothetical protein